MNEPIAASVEDKINLLCSWTRHVGFVRLALQAVSHDLERRALAHDESKLRLDEFEGFSRINAAARINKFGSPEYAAGMAQERATIDLHFGRNRHHPEFYSEHPEHLVNHGRDCTQACGMTFLDVIEMVCDWWGARKGYDDSRSWEESLEVVLKHKGPKLTPEQLWLAKEVGRFLKSANP